MDTKYERVLLELCNTKHHDPRGIKLVFESYNLKLNRRRWVLAMCCLLNLRPTNRQLSELLWNYARKNEDEILPYAYDFAEDIYLNISFATTWEERSVAISRATRREKNPAFKGVIIARDIKTQEDVPFIGPEEATALGFNPGAVYDCVNDKAHTHNGHVFVRIQPEEEDV